VRILVYSPVAVEFFKGAANLLAFAKYDLSEFISTINGEVPFDYQAQNFYSNCNHLAHYFLFIGI
jgi:hypothetical protein